LAAVIYFRNANVLNHAEVFCPSVTEGPIFWI